MKVAIWIIAIAELIRAAQNAIQLHIVSKELANKLLPPGGMKDERKDICIMYRDHNSLHDPCSGEFHISGILEFQTQ